jgi:hypothetical protein
MNWSSFRPPNGSRLSCRPPCDSVPRPAACRAAPRLGCYRAPPIEAAADYRPRADSCSRWLYGDSEEQPAPGRPKRDQAGESCSPHQLRAALREPQAAAGTRPCEVVDGVRRANHRPAPPASAKRGGHATRTAREGLLVGEEHSSGFPRATPTLRRITDRASAARARATRASSKPLRRMPDTTADQKREPGSRQLQALVGPHAAHSG